MPRSSTLPLLCSLSLLLCACGSEPDSAQTPLEARSLAAFGSCEDLSAYLRTQLSKQAELLYEDRPGHGGGQPGLPGPIPDSQAVPGTSDNAESANDGNSGAQGPSSQTPSFSGTNNQELGVDEADILKSDGKRMYLVHQGTLRILDLQGERPVLTDTLTIREDMNYWGKRELLLHGSKLLVVEQTYGLPTDKKDDPKLHLSTRITQVDTSVPGAAKIERELDVEGRYVSARMVGPKVSVVTNRSHAIGLKSPWPFYNFDHLTDAGVVSGTAVKARSQSHEERWEEAVAKARAHNDAIIAAASETDLLPRYWYRDLTQPGHVQQTGLLYPCEHAMRPGVSAGLGMLSVLSFDLSAGISPPAATGVVSRGSTVYAKADSLYVATSTWSGFFGAPAFDIGIGAATDGSAVLNAYQIADPVPSPETEQSRGPKTFIHKFALNESARPTYRASGEINGTLLNQFAMSEKDEVLRVAATARGDGPSESFVATLRERGNTLVELGRVGGLGKTETIRSVRFMEDVAYVVTFRQTDPFYTIDLSDPANPQMLGELKIEGFSAYLHPLSPGYVLGVGRDADAEGQIRGLQISMFDVTDLRQPRRVHNYTLDNTSSQVEFDHHAFLYWNPTQSLVVPVRSWSPQSGQPLASALLMDVDVQRGISLRQTISHMPADTGSGQDKQDDGPSHPIFSSQIFRSMVLGDKLLTVSGRGIASHSLQSAQPLSWTDF